MSEQQHGPTPRYATFMEETGIALELINDGSGIGWVTGYGGKIWFARTSDGDLGTIPEDVFEDSLLEHDTIVMDAVELPAFRELIE